jgi:hypothetical protein
MSIALIGRMLADKAGFERRPAFEGPLARVAGPLQKARAGGVIDLSAAEASFVVADASGALIRRPNSLNATVAAEGRIEDGGFAIHRFYLGSQGEDAPQNFLQVIAQDGHVVPGEIKLLQKLAEVTPASQEEWDLWLVGDDETPPFLTGPSIKWEGTYEFSRFWSPGPRTVPARTYFETIRAPGEGERTVSSSAMLFSRPLSPDLAEWLQLAVCQTGTERWVEAYVGIKIDAGEVVCI